MSLNGHFIFLIKVEKMSSKRYALLILFIVCAGISLRIYTFIQSSWMIDYDEALIGISALNVIDTGDIPATIPGQSTIGSIEIILLSVLYRIDAPVNVLLRIYSLAINMLYIVSIGYLAKNVGGEKIGLAAALLAAIPSPYMIVTGSKIWGATIETIIAGNFLLLLISHSSEKQKQKYFWGGIISGAMIWFSWLSFFYLLPIWLGFTKKITAQLKLIIIYSIGGVIGATPIIIHNISYPLISIQTVLEEEPRTVSRIDGLQKFITEQLPTQLTGFSSWYNLPSFIPMLVTFIFLVALSIYIRDLYKNRKSESAEISLLVIMLAITIPVIYINSRYINFAFVADIDATGRYLLPLHSIIPIVLSYLISRKITAPLLGIILLINFWGILSLNYDTAYDSPYYNRQPQHQINTIINLLDERDIGYVWTDIGIGQPIQHASKNRIIAGDYIDIINGGIPRFPEFREEILNTSDIVAYVVAIIPNQTDIPLVIVMEQMNIEYEIFYLGHALLVIPSSPIHPYEVKDGLGFQY